MGCTQSKIENEEAVTRCKERKQFMKEAVSARNAFAAAHSANAMYLKNTGAALSDYAQGEVQNPVLHQSTLQSAAAAQSSFEKLPPPPPPPGSVPSVAPLQRSVTMPEMMVAQNDQKPKPSPIIEEEENEIEDEESASGLVRRRRGSGHKKEVVVDDDAPPPVPPSPRRTHPPSPPRQEDATFEYIFSVENMPGPTLSEFDINRDEIHSKDFDDRPPPKREVGVDYVDDGRRSAKVETVMMMPEKSVMEPPPPPPEPAVAAAVVGKSMKKTKHVGTGSMDGKRMVNDNLLTMSIALDDHFLKASESAHDVSKMLEATRLHYHSNFADNRGNYFLQL